MRVVSLAAGAGGMVCGSCIRDNRVAATLISQGRDITLLPLYTPLRTDEANVSLPEVRFGGISVYLRQLGLKKLPAWLVHILEKPLLLRQAMRFSSSVRAQDLGPLTVSVLNGVDGPQRPEIIRVIQTLKLLAPDVVNLPDLMLIALAQPIKEQLKVPVVCTLSGEDIFLDQIPEPHRTQSFQLIKNHAHFVDRFVAVTEYFADHSAKHFGLPRERVSTIPMGVKVEDFSPANPPDDGTFIVGYLARICPEKGLLNLVEAMGRLRAKGRRVIVRAAGYLGRADRAYFKQIKKTVRKLGNIEDFHFLGEISRQQKIEFFQGLHAFSVPTVYREAKGLYLLEALASAVPVAQPAHGSFPELIAATNGGLLYDPSDATGLDDALMRLMDDAELRRRLGNNGHIAVAEKFTDTLMANRTWSLYESLVRP